MSPQRESIIDSSVHRFFDWREIWQYRELFYFFTWRDVKIKYKQTVLGFLWAVLQPLLLMWIITVFFGRALKVQSDSLPYTVFVFSGILMWNVFSSGLVGASNSMVNNALIIRKIYFPRLVIPISSIMVSLFDFAMAFIVFLVYLIFVGQPVHMSALWSWPLAIALAVMATIGPGCLLAALNVKYRDFRYVIPFLTQLLFFISPVIYPVDFLEHPLLQYVVVASPLYAAMEFFRFPLSGALPQTLHIAISLLSAALLLAGGMVYFKRTEDFFADFS